ncbi:MAG: type II toxin-antitoxin system prevent-host-death family antitoxin, partial [Desulfosarcina sp.]
LHRQELQGPHMEATMLTSQVGIRDAKIHLSKFLKIVKNGGEIVITERGKPIGKIVPYQSANLPLSERLKNLEMKGLVEPVVRKHIVKLHPPVPLPDDIAQKYLSEDRNHGR